MKQWWILLLALTSFCCSQATSPEEKAPRMLTKEESALVQADNTFGLGLFRRMSAAEPEGNIFISPLSVSMALGMTLNGADGATRDSMARTLALDGLTEEQINASYRSLIDLLGPLDPGVAFTIANSVWYRNEMTVRQDFSDRLSLYFDAPVTALDFRSPQASATINTWVSDATAGRIPSIVPDQIPSDMVLYLINAVYFKGAWSRKFDKAQTAMRDFHLADGSTRQVPMMSSGEWMLSVASDDRFQMVDLPYGDSLYSMTIILPRAGHTVDELISGLDRDVWLDWIGRLRSAETIISLPKFSLSYETKLNDVLSSMGMGGAFSDGADFSRFSNDYTAGELRISEVKHKTFVEVNEEGTEAAAATSVGMVNTSAPQPIVVDRPFLLAIRERHSGAILFLGRIVDPQ